MNYRKMSQSIRKAMEPLREQSGRWLLMSIRKAIDNGEKVLLVPSGTYIIHEPLLMTSGFEIIGTGIDCVLQPTVYPFWKYVDGRRDSVRIEDAEKGTTYYEDPEQDHPHLFGDTIAQFHP